MEDRVERMGLNEALFREVNERVRAINQTFGGGVTEAEFVCECADAACLEPVCMTLPEYEQLRAEPTHFAVRRGHDEPAVEVVIEDRDYYVVVAKKPGAPSAVAIETDPR